MRERAREGERLEEPVVERAVHLELERADGVGDALDVVAQAVGVVVERVDAPLVAGVVVGGVADAVEQRVAQPDVGRGHVDLRAEGAGGVRELAGAHALEEVEVLCDRAVAEGRLAARLVGRAAVFVGLLRREVADVGLTAADHLQGVLIELVEVVRREKRLQLHGGFRRVRVGGLLGGSLVVAHNGGHVEVGLAADSLRGGRGAVGLEAEAMVGPAGDEPLDVLDDGFDVLDVLLRRIGVVHAEVAAAAVFAGDAEVEADGLGVADVEVAVGLRRETRDDLRVAFLGNMGRNDVADEIGGRGSGGGGRRLGHKEAARMAATLGGRQCGRRRLPIASLLTQDAVTRGAPWTSGPENASLPCPSRRRHRDLPFRPHPPTVQSERRSRKPRGKNCSRAPRPRSLRGCQRNDNRRPWRR